METLKYLYIVKSWRLIYYQSGGGVIVGTLWTASAFALKSQNNALVVWSSVQIIAAVISVILVCCFGKIQEFTYIFKDWRVWMAAILGPVVGFLLYTTFINYKKMNIVILMSAAYLSVPLVAMWISKHSQ